MPLLNKHIKWKLLLYLSFGFFIFTIIGTLSHELGHFTVAELLGYNAHINYQSCWWTADDQITYTDPYHDSALITMGGPLQTMVTGSVGFFLIFWTRGRSGPNIELNFKQWLLIFLACFWSREVFNFMMEFIIYFQNGRFPTRGDEERLAFHYDLPLFAIAEPAAIIAAIVLGITFFKFIPLQSRTTFLLAGIIGSAAGYYFWLVKYGPMLMP